MSKVNSEIREITLNGITFEVLTPAQIKKYRLSNQTFWKVGTKYLYVEMKNWSHLYQAAGYDTNKLDFAYPEQWRKQNPEVDRKFKKGDFAAWYYGDKDSKIFGRPAWRSEVKHKVITLAKRKLGM